MILVIKVLRRNGSWENTNKNQDSNNNSKNSTSKLKTYEEDFQLDEKFEILAKEIKKRMNKRDFKISNSPKAGKKIPLKKTMNTPLNQVCKI